jgi:hypothetical protein
LEVVVVFIPDEAGYIHCRYAGCSPETPKKIAKTDDNIEISEPATPA